MSRESAYGALFTLLETVPGIRTFSRKLRLLEEVGGAELPALFLAVDRQMVQPRPQGLPPKHTLGAVVYLYAANPDPHTAAGIALNNLIDAVEAALAPTPGIGVQTLGGAVAHCWIEGTVEVFEMPKGQRAASIIPVHMLVP